MATPSIILDGVSKRYRVYSSPQDRLREVFGLKPKEDRVMEINALQSVTLTINHGEFCGIIGRNGAGKSTLLKIIAGQTSPSEGTLKVYGRKSLLQLGLGFDPELTGRENVYNSIRFLSMSSSVSEETVKQIIEFSELGDFINFPIKTYSSGMYSRLAFAAGIAVDPDILIADEVLAVGDINFAQKCLAKMRDFKERGKTVILVTHDLNAVRVFCDRAILIEHGKMVRDGECVDVCEDYRNLMLYGVLLPPSGVRRNTAARDAEIPAAEPAAQITDAGTEPQPVAGQPQTVAKTEQAVVTKEEAPSAAAPQKAALADNAPDPETHQLGGGDKLQVVQFLPSQVTNVADGWLTPRQETFISVIDAGWFEAVRIRHRDQKSYAASVRGGSPVCFDLKFILREPHEFHSVGFTMHDAFGQIVLHLNSSFAGFAMTRKPGQQNYGLSFMFDMPRLRAGQYSFSFSVDVVDSFESALAFKHDFDFGIEVFYDKNRISDRQYGAVVLANFAVAEIAGGAVEPAMIGTAP